MSELVRVVNPDRWWLAARTDLAWLVDPDREDGQQRHEDRDERAWAEIADAVEAIARLVEQGSYELDPAADPEDGVVALVSVDLSGLRSAEDREIVTTWLRTGDSPCGDPWEDWLVNGRHRLWNSWRARPRAVLPIYSETLSYLDDVPAMGAEFAAVNSLSAAEGLTQMPAPVAARSTRYVNELARVARVGGHVVDLPRQPGPSSPRTRWWHRAR